MDENDSITGAEIILNGPADGEGRLIGEVDGNADLAAGKGGGSRCSGSSGGGGGGSRVMDLDGGKVWVVGIRRGLLGIHCVVLQKLKKRERQVMI